jgi:hypothetical protein
MNKKTFIFFSFVTVLLLSSVSLAKAEIFSVHLFYNSQTKILAFNKNISDNVSLDSSKDISILEFFNNDFVGPYIMSVFDIKGEEISKSEFSLKNGAFNYEIPYFSTAKRLSIFEKSSGKKILEADLSKYVTCNGNGLCEFEKGENLETCLSDCASGSVKYSEQTTKILKENGEVIKDNKTGEILLKGISYQEKETKGEDQISDKNNTKNKLISIVIIVLMSLFSGSIIFFIIRKLRKQE